MIIQAPLSSFEEVEHLVKAGADEFYCGIVPLEWREKYGYEIPINCRGTYTNSNFETLEELNSAVVEAHNYGKEILVAFNETSYNQNQIKLITNLLDQLSAIHVDGIIVADLPLLLEIKKRNYNFKISLSGEANCTSSAAVEFYKEMGIQRVVFPRHISIREMNEIIKSNPDLEYEAFFLNEGCFFSGGYCFGIHHECYAPLCRASQFKLKANNRESVANELFEKTKIEGTLKYACGAYSSYNGVAISKCGLCSLKLLKDISIGCLKIVGRTGDISEKVKWIQIAKKAIELSNNINDYNEYKKKCMETFMGEYKTSICDSTLGCYYPNEYIPEHILGE